MTALLEFNIHVELENVDRVVLINARVGRIKVVGSAFAGEIIHKGLSHVAAQLHHVGIGELIG